MTKKQAVVVIHGMGEQIPMETLSSFVDSVWKSDRSLVDAGELDPNTGGPRTENAIWSKPDRRNRSFELHRITTETAANGLRTDFFEYYWAHQMVDTTWEHVRSWLFGLMFRNPVRDVPRSVLLVWIILWLVAAGALVGWIFALKPGQSEPGTWLGAIILAALTAALAAFIAGFVTRYFGDVARYVRAKPANVARRQQIREQGVQLLETLMGVEADGSFRPSGYDRIIVVGHSLGSIVAYDMLAHAFARVNAIRDKNASALQPEREKLEQMVRDAEAVGGGLDVSDFQAAQARARLELNAAGNPWIVSDFVTLGSPLTHAEFLIVRDRAGLTEAKAQRILPTCPPVLEYDLDTKERHFTYKGTASAPARAPAPALASGSDAAVPPQPPPRVPHHAAPFAYTRWSNIFAPHKAVVIGDIISGPLAESMGMQSGSKIVSGIQDISVMPGLDAAGKPLSGHTRPWFAHTRYWSMPKRREGDPLPDAPYHIVRLREVLRLGEKPASGPADSPPTPPARATPPAT